MKKFLEAPVIGYPKDSDPYTIISKLNSLSRKLNSLTRINTEDDNQTAYTNAIALAAEQDYTNYGKQGSLLEKPKRVKRRN